MHSSYLLAILLVCSLTVLALAGVAQPAIAQLAIGQSVGQGSPGTAKAPSRSQGQSTTGLSSLPPAARHVILDALQKEDTPWIQQAELIASDGESFNGLGQSVAISGSTIVVGAPEHRVGSNDEQGAVYVFVESGGTWTRQAELTASDGAAVDEFGSSVAVDGSTIVVGSSLHTVGSNADQGAAYVFVESGGAWSQQAELTASDGAAGEAFGISVAVSGSTAVVGAYLHKVGSNTGQGAAYVFAQSGTTWTQQAELTASEGAVDDQFGLSVAVDGSTALVGAPEHKVDGEGAAYVFVQNGTTWNQQAVLIPSDEGGAFGWSVALSGSTAVLGAPYHTVGTNLEVGGAYVFMQSGTTWSQKAELLASDGLAGDEFGSSVAVSGSLAVLGATGYSTSESLDQGIAYVFAESGGTWTQQTELAASDGADGDYFGSCVALAGSTAVVGAPDHWDGSNADQGAAYVFGSSGPLYTLSAAPSTVTVLGSGRATSTITVTPENGFTGSVSFSASGSGLANGITAAFSPNPVTSSTTLKLTVSPTGSGEGNIWPITVLGTSGTLTQTTIVTLQAAGYILTSSSLSVLQGSQGTTTVAIIPLGGFNGSVSFSVSGLPNGVTAAFSPNPATSSSTLTLTASAGAETGTVPVSITGTSGSFTQTITINVTVVAPPTYGLAVFPNRLTLVQGSQGISTITITPLNGFSGSVSLSASGLPDGITAAFSPNPATSTSTLTLTANVAAPPSVATVALIGTSGGLTQTTPLVLTVISPVSLSPASLSFGKEAIGGLSAVKSVTLKNAGAVVLNISNISITPSTNFKIFSDTCGSSLAASKTCKVGVKFDPTTLGALTGTLSFTDNASGSPQTIPLSGTGIADAALTPASATYAKQKAGTSSAAKKFTLANDQTVALTGIAISMTGDFGVSATTCGASLAAKEKCTISVVFEPTATGTLTGELKVSDSASDSPQTSTLTGTGD